MKKRLDLSREFATFEGNPLKINDAVLTLRTALLGYLMNADRMGLTVAEEATAYEVGLSIGRAEGEVDLPQAHYDLLKKLVDHGKVRQGHAEEPVWILVIAQKCKRLIDAAVTVEAEGAA